MNKQFVFNEYNAVPIFPKNVRSMFTSHETSSQGSFWEQNKSLLHHENNYKNLLKQ